MGKSSSLEKDGGSLAMEFRSDVVKRALQQITDQGRVDRELGLELYRDSPMNELCMLANHIKERRHGKNVHFNLNLHVNTTNICVLACRFCAFRKGPKHEDAYALSTEQYLERVRPLASTIDEVHSVGGLHPEWRIEHYEEIYRAMKAEFPHISLKSLTAVEVKHIGKRSGLSIRETLMRLRDSGLDSLPGGGAEILVDGVRDRICRGKESSDEYLSIHRTAHQLGIPTNCTMLFGTVETMADRITHLHLLRSLQDETSGFQCFVPYPFLPDHTRLPEAQIPTGQEVIRTIAISRIMLDNIPHLKAYRMNIGDHLASIGILSGADDIDGTVQQEEIMHAAGSTTPQNTGLEGLIRLIESTGQQAVQRNTVYTKFEPRTLKNLPQTRNLPLAG